MKRYEEYKDSGVEWIGDIPKHWEIVHFRRCVSLKQGLQISQDRRFESPGKNRHVYITVKYVNSEKSEIDTEYIENPCQSVICNEDDVLLARTGATGVVVTNVKGVFHNNFFKIIYDKQKILKEYLVYYLRQNTVQNYLKLIAGTTTIPDLNHGAFLSTKIVLPSIEEQNNIINFLEEKTSQIDNLINKKEELIETLKISKQKLISETVTKGLHKDVEMKDSGADWIEEIPNKWKIISVRNLIMMEKLEVQDGNHGESHPVSDDYVDYGVPFIMASDIKQNKVNFEKCKYITYQQSQKLRIGFTKKGDVLITHKGTIGEVAIVNETLEYPYIVLTPQVTYYRIKDDRLLNNEFLFYLMQSDFIKSQIKDISSMQSTRAYIGIVAQRAIKLIIPDLKEQEEIVSILNIKVKNIDKTIIKVQEQLEILKKSKQKLITEVVTGKIDVRDYKLN